ncbi:MAG TPA: class I SAM-dependent methyltransferase [Actinobacteria bacterium]|nr:class I SAM-dependent methyltransferase [Actinomycetota bacterium]
MNIKKLIKYSEYRNNSSIVERMLPHLGDKASLLDIGCAGGGLTLKYAEQIGVSSDRVRGVEIDEEYRAQAAEKFESISVDMEVQELPFGEESFDVVVCNQILEHIKNINHFVAQVDRVTKKGGYVLFAVPNLAALHNRLGLLFGGQPRCIKLLTTHVRGFSPRALRDYLSLGNRFKIISVKGSGFYPWPSPISKFLARVFPSLSVYQAVLLQKTVEGDWDFWTKLEDESDC